MKKWMSLAILFIALCGMAIYFWQSSRALQAQDSPESASTQEKKPVQKTAPPEVEIREGTPPPPNPF